MMTLPPNTRDAAQPASQWFHRSRHPVRSGNEIVLEPELIGGDT
jgi:hypothetical protein